MSDAKTIPHQVRTFPVRTVGLEVIEGPDSGKIHGSIADTLTVGTAPTNDFCLTDETISRYHLELRHTDRGIVIQDHSSTNGTRVGNLLVERAVVPPNTILDLGKTRLKILAGDPIETEVHGDDRLGGVVGRTPAMRLLMARITKVAQSDVSVLLLGETGTGKEVLARAIHDSSPRASRPFETVDCGSLLPTLIASELFGHERGAFTGAEKQHAGAFERANGGTIFLDEIGELPISLQSTLLGALERRSFRRVGGTDPVSVDVRVVCATNRDLRTEVNESRFREDLYYRIAVVMLQVPALRDRTDDIPLLVEHFLKDAGVQEDYDKLISKRTLDTLKHHRWQGNVRELRNFVEAALAMGEAPSLDPNQRAEEVTLDGELTVRLTLSKFSDSYRDTRDSVLREFETQYLRALIDKTSGNVAKAARLAKMDRTYLGQLLKRHGLS